jgi:hypothetical protein
MLSAFVGQISGLFDKRFLVRVWFPTFLFGAAGVLVAALAVGPEPAVALWDAQPALTRAWFGAGALVAVTFVAYICDNLMGDLVRFYEGYWPTWMTPLSKLFLKTQRHRWQRLKDQMQEAVLAQNLSRYNSLHNKWHHTYPRKEEHLLPTRLGNVMRASETYCRHAYNLDAVVVWPRMVPFIPKEFQERLAQASTPLTTMLYSATLSLLLAIASGIALVLSSEKWWLFVASTGGGLLLFLWCHESAVQRAEEYGLLTRAAFDLYREELLKALHVPLPLSPVEERAIWPKVVAWWYKFVIPQPDPGRKTWSDVGQVKLPGPPKPQQHEHVVHLERGLPPKEESA